MTEIVGTSQDWLRCYRPRPAAAVRLICLPHASGNASFYRVWLTRLPPSVELVAVQYPGR
ncbi:MAG: thioesterase II family protein, partial [Micromonosporaceae bacterium]